MVLVSFDKKFIYTKTIKTAGTSVEVFFQPYCLPPGDGEVSHMSSEIISDHGIVGYRGPGRPADTVWAKHMPAAHIRRYLGDEIWQQYFKFCVIRNPFDKVVSRYFFSLSDEQRANLINQDFAELRSGFLAAIRHGLLAVDRNKYVMDGEVCMDFFIRYEHLSDDVAEVCRRLGIERDVNDLPRLKSKIRFSDVHFSEFYDREAESIVAKTYAFELHNFGYRLRE